MSGNAVEFDFQFLTTRCTDGQLAWVTAIEVQCKRWFAKLAYDQIATALQADFFLDKEA